MNSNVRSGRSLERGISSANPAMEDRSLVEKFTPFDLLALRDELLRADVDTFQAAEIVASFLSGRGYGVCSDEARSAATLIETPGTTSDHIQAELERVARVM